MNRVMRDVLPTGSHLSITPAPQMQHCIPDCSPRNTSLNFFKGFVYEPTLAMVAAVMRVACPRFDIVQRSRQRGLSLGILPWYFASAIRQFLILRMCRTRRGREKSQQTARQKHKGSAEVIGAKRSKLRIEPFHARGQPDSPLGIPWTEPVATDRLAAAEIAADKMGMLN